MLRKSLFKAKGARNLSRLARRLGRELCADYDGAGDDVVGGAVVLKEERRQADGEEEDEGKVFDDGTDESAARRERKDFNF